MAGAMARPMAKGTEPVDYDPIAEAKKLLDSLKASGMSASSDVPGVADPNGVPISTGPAALRVPARVDPALIAEAQQQLARANALQGLSSFVPATVFGVKHGRQAGPMTGASNPAWDLVRSGVTAPVQQAQLDVDQKNATNDVINKVVNMGAGAGAQDRATATQLASTLGTAKVAAADRATQQAQFEESQETTRRGQDLTLKGLQFRMLNGPEAAKLKQLRGLNQSALDNLQDLEDKIRNGTASAVSGTIFGKRVGTNAGVDTANTVGMLANNLSQVAERRGLRGPMQDEIAHELNSGISQPAAGLKSIAKWRKYVQDFNDELNTGQHPSLTSAPPAAEPFNPDTFLNGQ